LRDFRVDSTSEHARDRVAKLERPPSERLRGRPAASEPEEGEIRACERGIEEKSARSEKPRTRQRHRPSRRRRPSTPKLKAAAVPSLSAAAIPYPQIWKAEDQI